MIINKIDEGVMGPDTLWLGAVFIGEGREVELIHGLPVGNWSVPGGRRLRSEVGAELRINGYK